MLMTAMLAERAGGWCLSALGTFIFLTSGSKSQGCPGWTAQPSTSGHSQA